MFIVIVLLILGCIDAWLLQCVCLACFVILVVRKYSFRDGMQVCLLGILFMLSLGISVPRFGNQYRVVENHAFYSIVRNGVNTYRIHENLDFDGVYQIDGNVEEDRAVTVAQAVKRFRGTLMVDSIELKAKPRLFHQVLMKALQGFPRVLSFVYRNDHHFFVSLGIQLAALQLFLTLLTRRVLTKTRRNLLHVFLLCVYGLFFGFDLNVCRHLLKRCHLKSETAMLVLLFLFPRSQFHLGFIMAFYPQIVIALFGELHPMSLLTMRLLILQAVFGSVHLLQVLVYRLWVFVYTGILIALILFQFHIAEWVLITLDEFLNHTYRLEFRGAIPLILLIAVLCLIHKPLTLFLTYSCLVLTLTYFPFPRVHFVNVGQGDAIIITTAFNAHVTVIDTGRQYAYGRVQKSLRAMGIRRIDQLIITHPDGDHNENQNAIIMDYAVSKQVLQKGDDVVFLTELLADTHYDDANENSLIYLLKTQRLSFLFMGDATVEQEYALMRDYPHLIVDVLKLGHHGSKTSSSERFLSQLKPQYAIASANPNVYNHPHPEVLALCYQYRIAVLKTYDLGNHTFVMTPFFDFIVSERGHFGIIKNR